MALFESGNPTLSEKMFGKALGGPSSGLMTVRGTMGKFGFLLLMVLAGAVFAWQSPPERMMMFLWIGLIGGFIAAMVISFKPHLAAYLSPAYGILEGFFVGAISAILNAAFAESYPGLVMQAVGLTFGVAIAMFLLYNFRIIKPTQKLKSIIITATAGIAIFYGLTLILRLFNVSMPFMYDSSWLGIGISLFVIAIAALNLILDFDRIEQGAAMGAPKYMEWFGAFGLLVTIVWLYIEILKLLARFASSRD